MWDSSGGKEKAEDVRLFMLHLCGLVRNSSNQGLFVQQFGA